MKKQTQTREIPKPNLRISEFRITEYEDHFRIEKRQKVATFFCFLGFKLWENGKKEIWNTIMKNNCILDIHNWMHTEAYRFETKEECLEWIENYNKYPIHYYL